MCFRIRLNVFFVRLLFVQKLIVMEEYARGLISLCVYVSRGCVDILSVAGRSVSESEWFAFTCTHTYLQLGLLVCVWVSLCIRRMAMAKLGAMSLLSFAVQYTTTRSFRSFACLVFACLLATSCCKSRIYRIPRTEKAVSACMWNTRVCICYRYACRLENVWAFTRSVWSTELISNQPNGIHPLNQIVRFRSVTEEKKQTKTKKNQNITRTIDSHKSETNQTEQNKNPCTSCELGWQKWATFHVFTVCCLWQRLRCLSINISV